jgi:phosphatidylglycerophosphate synthase
MVHIPNLLTGLRLVLVPIFLLVLFTALAAIAPARRAAKQGIETDSHRFPRCIWRFANRTDVISRRIPARTRSAGGGGAKGQ